MPRFKQHDMTDCGACCLGYVAARYGRTISIARLRQLSGTAQHGSTALGLVEAAQQLGFVAKGAKGAADALPTVPFPAIAHCQIDQRYLHYVVLLKWRRRVAHVMDPATGRVEKWPHEKFKSIWTGVLVLLAPGVNLATHQQTMSPVRRLWKLLQPHRGVLLQMFTGAVMSTLLALAMSIYVQKIVDSVIPDTNRPLLNLLGVTMLAVLAFRLVLGVFQSLLSLRTAQQIDAAIILGYYRHLLRLPQPFFDTMRIGEIASRIGDGVKVRNFLNSALINLLLNPLILVFALAAMFFYSAKLAALSLALVPCHLLLWWFANLRNRTYQRQLMERSADFGAQFVETLNVQSILRRFRLENHFTLKAETRLVRLLKTTWRAAIAALACGTAGTFFTQAYTIALLWLGASLVLDASLTPGQLMSCYTLAGYLTGPLSALVGLNTSVQEALIATDRLFEVMDLEREKDQGLIAFTAAHAAEINFNGVSFHHAGRLATLNDISLTIPAARITALAGESGCGKSTLLALIQRLYAPQHGEIRFGQIDARHFELNSLRRHLAVVPQHTVLLSGTVLENLAPGETHPDMERVLRLCREVGVLDFIEQLPQNFLTPLSENGANLSGGQRQRLALVRALYLDAPILLLDEPSSALDSQSEEQLKQLLVRQRSAGKTVVVVAHTTALLSIADCVVTMARGRIVNVESRSLPGDGSSEETASSTGAFAGIGAAVAQA